MASDEEQASRPFDDLRRALTPEPRKTYPAVAPTVQTDASRGVRTGVPEIVYGARKTVDQVVSALRALVAASGAALATRCSPEMLADVAAVLADGSLDVSTDPVAGVIEVRTMNASRLASQGLIGIVAAGTSDLPICREIELLTAFFGAGVRVVSDVGVAGLHRLVAPLESLMADEVDVLVVVAGMDGALPSVVTGLVDVPVIGVPTSTGYGFGGDGTAALMAMLQSCSPGLSVVNIDNGVGAAAAAWRVVRQRHGYKG